MMKMQANISKKTVIRIVIGLAIILLIIGGLILYGLLLMVEDDRGLIP